MRFALRPVGFLRLALVTGATLGLASLPLAPARADAVGGTIIVVDFNAFGGLGGVVRIDPVTGARSTLSENAVPVGGPSFVDPGDVALDRDGKILVADFNAFADSGGGVIRVDPVTGARVTVSANGAPGGGPSLSDPSGIAIAPGGDILVADRQAFGGGGGVLRVNPVTGARTLVSENASPAGGPSFVEPTSLALAPDGAILVADEDAFGGPGGLIRVDPLTGVRTTLSVNTAPAGGPSFVQPVGIVVAADGSLLVTDEDAFSGSGGLMRVDPVTGARTTVSANGTPAGGPSFAQPYGIVVAGDGSVLVADFDAFGGSGGVIRVNTSTGARARVSANGAPAGGPAFLDPLGIALLPPSTLSPPATRPLPPRPPASRDVTAPVISFASVRPSTFAVGAPGERGRLPASRRAPRGTSLRLRLSEPARVTVTIQRRSSGRRVGGRCRRQTRANERRRRCTRFVAAGSFSYQAAGTNRRRFGGRVGGRRLRPGRYRAVLRAIDAARNRSGPRTLRFRVVRG